MTAGSGKARERTQQLIEAVARKDTRNIPLLAQKGADVDAFAPEDMLPPALPGGRLLHAALCDKDGNTDQVLQRLLLGAGADPKKPASSGANALHYLCSARGERAHLARELLEKGVCLDAVDAHGRTPLHCALEPLTRQPPEKVSVELVRELVEAGADVNAERGDGLTPLGYALCPGAGDTKERSGVLAISNRVAEALLQAGANPNAHWPRERSLRATPLLCVALRRLGDQWERYPFTARDRLGLLLSNGADPNLGEDAENASPLALALGYRNLDACWLLLSNGADPNGPEGKDTTLPPLHQAAMIGPPEAEEFVGQLLAHDARADERDPTGGTALHCAARRRDIPTARRLLAAGADVNACDANGLTALHFAAETQGARSFQFSRLLIEAGADPAARNAAGETPADLLGKRHEQLLQLYEQGLPRQPSAAHEAAEAAVAGL